MFDADEFEVDGRAAAVMVAGMQAVALADGDADPRELALIASLRAELPEGVDPSGVVLEDDRVLALFVRFLALVALVDGELSPAESATIYELAAAHGVGREQVGEIVRSVKAEMLSMFSGVRVFRDQAIDVARFIGVDEAQAAKLIDG